MSNNILDLNKKAVEFTKSGDYQSAHELLELAEKTLKDLPEDTSSPKLTALTMMNMSSCYKKHNKLPMAISYIKKAIIIYKKQEDDPKSLGKSYLSLSCIYYRQLQYQKSLKIAEKALKTAPVSYIKIKALYVCGNSLLKLHFWPEAAAKYHQGLVLAKATKHKLAPKLEELYINSLQKTSQTPVIKRNLSIESPKRMRVFSHTPNYIPVINDYKSNKSGRKLIIFKKKPPKIDELTAPGKSLFLNQNHSQKHYRNYKKKINKINSMIDAAEKKLQHSFNRVSRLRKRKEQLIKEENF